ncbi:MAG: peptidase E [Clostridiales bacterium]|nr:peptidase E [Clostridiales bacterium]
MSKKIVAIGGGHNGRIREDGTKAPYETGPMDLEIIRLTEKQNPNFLFLGHAGLEYEDSYFETMVRIYKDMYSCECKMLKAIDLTNTEKVNELISWADIIYEGGGNTKTMIELWVKTGFDKILKQAYEDGKVMCGVSAGANCWFKACSSDALQIETGDPNAPLIKVECLGLINAFVTPHCDENGRFIATRDLLKDENIVAILLSNCAAIEIVDDKYKIILSELVEDPEFLPYVQRAFWTSSNSYNWKNIKVTEEFKKLSEILL